MLEKIYSLLLARHGDLGWWPAKTPYEVMVGAVLTQNTSWTNVEKAIENFGENLTPSFVQNVDLEELKKIINPAGFFNQKAVYLKQMTQWFAKYDFSVEAVRCRSLEDTRYELLSTKGIGKETADSILLYAIGFPTFVIDAYTARLCERFSLPAGKGYDALKNYFESNLPLSEKMFNNFHALIVINAKDYCRKRNPLCDTCPLANDCEKNI
ncbi:MAG: endonuclease [Defluviitaleaceae bacterium]|nr:endonuclease [Defluviitaleaceae bacterium]